MRLIGLPKYSQKTSAAEGVGVTAVEVVAAARTSSALPDSNARLKVSEVKTELMRRLPLERNESSAVSYGLIGCLKQPHHSKAGMPIIGRRLVIGDAIDEILELSLERFSAIHFW